MEHIYTIKVKRKADPRGLYPSERRYSASTVLGLAWLHLALAATCLLLAGLALYTPPLPNNFNDVNEANSTSTDYEISIPLVISPSICAAGALGAGFLALLASRKWYVDHNITWFFLSSVVSGLLASSALIVIVYWIISISESGLSFCDYFSDSNLFGKVKMVPQNNSSWLYVIKVPVEELQSQNIPLPGEEGTRQNKTRKVLSINILIAVFIELIWSVLSLRISWNGMRSAYPDEDNVEVRPGAGGTVRVVTEIKGNNTKHLPKNTKILPPQPDLIEHHPKSNKVRKLFKMQQESGGFFVKPGEGDKGFHIIESKDSNLIPTESNTEYKDRMMDFLNNCAKRDTDDDSESVKSPVQDPVNIYPAESWGDLRDHTIYDQNNLDLDKIIREIVNKKEIVPETVTVQETVPEDDKNSEKDKTNDKKVEES